MSLQIKGKFISSEAIDGEKLLLQSGQAVRLMTASGEVRLIELDESTGKVKVNGVVVALQPDLVAEINRAVAAETTLQANIDAEVSARAAADSALATATQAAIEAEASARVAADASLQGTISSVSSALSQEVSDRQAGDASTLSSANSYTDTKVAALVDSAPELLNTLKELSDALGGDENFAATISNQIGAVSSNLSAEISRATSAETALQSEVDAVESSLAQEVSDRTAAVAAVQAEVDAEEARAIAAEASLQAQIDTLSGASGSGTVSLSSLDARLDVIEGSGEGSVTKAEQDAKDYADAAVLVEKTRAEAAEGVLTSSIAQEVSDRQAAITQLSTSTQALIQAEADARVADVNDEEARAMAAESALDARLDVLEGSGEGSVAKAEADAKAYADQKVADLVNSAPAVLDTLQELAAAINNDASFAATVAGQIGDIATDLATEEARALAAEGAIAADLATETANRISDVNAEESRAMAAESGLASDIAAEQTRAEAVEAGLAADISAEETRAMGAESALDGRLDVLEAREHRKMKFVLSAQDITNGYVDLAHEAMANSVVAAVGRLMIHEGAGEDFTMSVVGGVSRLTFVGNLVHPSEEQLSAGDVIFVKYFA